MSKLVDKIIWLEDALWIVKEQWEGTENLRYHGSASYETFIKAENLDTKEIKTFGSEKYKWKIASEYIKWLERYHDTVHKAIKELSDRY